MYFFDLIGKTISPSDIKDGDIVSFSWYDEDTGKTKRGYAWMRDSSEFYAAYNLYRDADDESGVWVSDELPVGVTLYSPTKSEFLIALDKFLGEVKDAPLNIPIHFEGDDEISGIERITTDIQNREDVYQHIIERYKTLLKEMDENYNTMLMSAIEEKKELQRKLKAAQTLTISFGNNKENQNSAVADFVKKFVKETKHFYKHDRKKADAIRQIMIKLGQKEADEDLDEWMEGKERAAEVHNHYEAGSNNQVFNGSVNGDFK
jgi:hypothetical protein